MLEEMRTQTPSLSGAALLGHMAAFAAVLAGLFLASRASYLLFHALAEFFRMAVDLAVFIVVLNARERMDNGYLVFLGPAFLGATVLTLLHTLAYKGMGVFPGYGADMPTQFWIASRGLMAVSFAAAPFFVERKPLFYPILAAYLAATAVLAFLIFAGLFPACFIEGRGLTPFKVYSEYAVILLFALAAFLAWRKRDRFDRPVLMLIIWAIAFTMAAELAFTFYVSVYGLSNLVGHFLIIVSTYFMYRAIVVTGIKKPQELLFRELAEAHSRLRRTIDLVPHMIQARDRDGRLLLLNKATAEALGASVPSLRGRLLAEVHLYPKEVKDILEEDMLIISGEALRSETEEVFTTASGERMILATSRTPFTPDNGLPSAVLAVSVDVTREKHDRALREDIERITRHDLRSPLSGLINLPELLAEDGNLTEDQRRILELIQESGRNMLEMINNSLDLYKLETGGYDLCLEPVNLPLLVSKVAENVRGICRERGVELDVRTGEEAGPLKVRAEGGLLYRLIHNLLTNAVEATPRGGTAGLEIDPRAGLLRITNVLPVPGEIRERMFDKYATWGKKLGTGLGTYSAKLIADAHGWDIAMDTSDERGTVLEVRFDRAGE